jgi:hypothetical protein
VLLLFVVPSLDVCVASAESPKAGVELGDWIEYELNWTTPPAPPYPLKIRREILGVNGSLLKLRTIQEKSDGSVTNKTETGDFINGTGAAAMVFIPPGLKPGDSVRIEGFGVVIINGTDKKTYLAKEHDVLWADFFEKGFDILVFWDKETGVALEIHISGGYREGVTKIADSNLWGSGAADDANYDFFGLLTLLLIITVISVGLLLWRRSVSSKR